ncbi:MAG: QueT transporter family protein [Clostridiales bacterium]|nr:QueT transporter family protein [Clostridiales bacterium]
MKRVYLITYGAMIAAIYTALTLMIEPIASGPIQFRISEALCILPYFTPAAIPGVTVGCLLSNLLMGSAAMDVVFGSVATLIGAVGSYAVRKSKWLVCVPPILSNTVIVPWVLKYAYGTPYTIPFTMLTVGVGEVLAIGVLGNVLLAVLDRQSERIFIGQVRR